MSSSGRPRRARCRPPPGRRAPDRPRDDRRADDEEERPARHRGRGAAAPASRPACRGGPAGAAGRVPGAAGDLAADDRVGQRGADPGTGRVQRPGARPVADRRVRVHRRPVAARPGPAHGDARRPDPAARRAGQRGGPGGPARPPVGVGLPAARRRRPARPPGRLLPGGTLRRAAVPGPGHRAADRGGRVQRPAARPGARHRGRAGRHQRGARGDRHHLAAQHGHPQRLTRVAVSGEGQPGIAKALHELTRMPVAIEDRYGNLTAWAGPGQPDPYPKESFAKREHLLRRLMRAGSPTRDGERLILLASPRTDVMGVLALIDPGRRADPADLVALEHGATVLAMELARLRGIADAELRLRRDLMHDLLAGTDDESALTRAEALDYDLRRPHRVVIVQGKGRARVHDALLNAVRRAMRQARQDGLFETWSGNVAVITAGQTDWEQLRRAIMSDLGGQVCLGVGGAATCPSDLPRSLREAGLALRLQKTLLPGDSACEYPKLGIFRMLAAIPDLSDVDSFVREWLGSLLDYDARRKAELVHTLTQYLEHGGNYDATAAELSVHKSTLKYRLQRIRQLTGLELNDPDVHFNLQLATRAWGTLQALHDEQ